MHPMFLGVQSKLTHFSLCGCQLPACSPVSLPGIVSPKMPVSGLFLRKWFVYPFDQMKTPSVIHRWKVMWHICTDIFLHSETVSYLKSEFRTVVLFAHNWLSDSICHFQNIIHSPLADFHYSQLVIMGLVCLFVCYIWLCFCLLCLFFVVIFRCASISWFKAVNTSHFFHPAHLLTFFVIYYICLMFIAAFTHLFVCCIVVSK